VAIITTIAIMIIAMMTARQPTLAVWEKVPGLPINPFASLSTIWAGFCCFMGRPQCGQLAAWSLTSFLQSGHARIAITCPFPCVVFKPIYHWIGHGPNRAALTAPFLSLVSNHSFTEDVASAASCIDSSRCFWLGMYSIYGRPNTRARARLCTLQTIMTTWVKARDQVAAWPTGFSCRLYVAVTESDGGQSRLAEQPEGLGLYGLLAVRYLGMVPIGSQVGRVVCHF